MPKETGPRVYGSRIFVFTAYSPKYGVSSSLTELRVL